MSSMRVHISLTGRPRAFDTSAASTEPRRTAGVRTNRPRAARRVTFACGMPVAAATSCAAKSGVCDANQISAESARTSAMAA
jgi:hypothetical protein